MAISSAGKRLGAVLLDGILRVVALRVGWTIWALGFNQSPAKCLLGMRVLDASTGRVASRGR